MVHGRYGQFQVLVDRRLVMDGGRLAILGVLPSIPKVVAAVRAALTKPAS